MVGKHTIQREVGYIMRDLNLSKECKEKWDGAHTRPLQEVLDEMEYELSLPPSLLGRARNLFHKTQRGIDKVQNFPSEVKTFIHRGKHGWSPRDNFSMDYSLAVQLRDQFTEFIQYFDPASDKYHSGAPTPMSALFDEEWSDERQEEHDAKFLADLKTIRNGFANYVIYQNTQHTFDNHELWLALHEDTMKGIHESFRLMGEWYDGLWW